MDSRTVGILGGGQLGRMLVEAAHRLNIKTVVLDAAGAPAAQIGPNQGLCEGSFQDADAVEKLAQRCDVITTEIEHVNTDILFKLVKAYPKLKIDPSPETLSTIKDKYMQKQQLIDHHVLTVEALKVDNSLEALIATGAKLGFPFMLKSRTFAYDGKGNYAVMRKEDIPDGLRVLANKPLYAEKWANFTAELSVMVVQTTNGQLFAYPTVETVQQDNICHLVYAPARMSDEVRLRAQNLAKDAVASFKGAGVYGVEMFLMPEVNEIAPRPHNSGHYTIEACNTSQYEAHIRAILNLPMHNEFTDFKTDDMNCIMLNLLGGDAPGEHIEIAKRVLSTPGAQLHLYGKTEPRKGRKMGHATITGGSIKICHERLNMILTIPLVKDYDRPIVGIIMGSDSDLPVMRPAAEILKKFDIPFELTIISAHRTPERMVTYARAAAQRGLRVIIAGAGGAAHLPGMTASETPIPVIGVPVRASVLDGLDSLLSIVQMPRGVPCATVGINNSTNAALLAIRILAVSDRNIRQRIQDYIKSLENETMVKVQKLESIGWENYD